MAIEKRTAAGSGEPGRNESAAALAAPANHYEAKQEARRARLEAAAERAAAASAAAFDTARAAVEGIPFGQPILVGHHSERRHRRDVNKMVRNMDKSVALGKKAAELARRAVSVGDAGISSDDPDAVAKLTDKRTDLERERDRMKAANVAWRKQDEAGLLAHTGRGLSDWTPIIAARYSWEKQPYPKCTLTKLGARIRDAAKRAVRIEAVQALAPMREEIGSAVLTVDPEDNRVTLVFSARLSREHYKTMRTHGFLWSPTRGGFTRKISGNAVHYARHLATRITAESATHNGGV